MKYEHKLLVNPRMGTRILHSRYGILKTIPKDDTLDYEHQGTAVLEYDPRYGNKFNPWWLISNIDGDISAYYRWFVTKELGIKLLKPAFGNHISIITGEKPPLDGWGYLNGTPINFHYTSEIFTNGEFWWLNVKSDDAINIRKKLGLPKKEIGLHLTIGRIIKT